jgi:hypothetical protein
VSPSPAAPPPVDQHCRLDTTGAAGSRNSGGTEPIAKAPGAKVVNAPPGSTWIRAVAGPPRSRGFITERQDWRARG